MPNPIISASLHGMYSSVFGSSRVEDVVPGTGGPTYMYCRMMPMDLANVEERTCPLPSALMIPSSGPMLLSANRVCIVYVIGVIRKSPHVIPRWRASTAISETLVTACGRTMSGDMKSNERSRNRTAGPARGRLNVSSK